MARKVRCRQGYLAKATCGFANATASRGTLADEAREGTAAASYQGRTRRVSPIHEDRIDQVISQPSPSAGSSSPPIQLPAPAASPIIQDQTVIPADPSRGVQPVTLPVIEAAPNPDTHVFSTSQWGSAYPNEDVEAAAKAAADRGYEVQP